MSAAHLEKLNDRQRSAVEHGVGLADGGIGGPLLIIAGAGSGKTNTLAHLIVNGADPRRILLMTFSRRAASEIGRRVARICARVLGGKADVLTERACLGGHLPRHRRGGGDPFQAIPEDPHPRTMQWSIKAATASSAVSIA